MMRSPLHVNSFADLDQFQRAAGPADVLQLVPVPAPRAQEINAEVINCGLAIGELQFNGASLAFPHGDLLKVEILA
jgi:hypothetical protein